MYKQTPKFRKQLNQNQLEVLRILFRYRFASRDLIAQYFNKKDVYRQLLLLEDRGFVGRRYEPSYKLAGKPAAYYLKPDGLRELQRVDGDIRANIKNLYRAKQASEEFINHCTSVFTISLRLSHLEPNAKFFTKTDLQKEDYSYFPQPLPDAYMKLQNGKHYFLQVLHAHQPFFIATRAVKRYVDYFENGIWDDTGTEFPVILFVVDTESIQRRLHKFISKNADDVKIYTAMKDDVLNSADGPLWHGIEKPDDVYTGRSKIANG